MTHDEIAKALSRLYQNAEWTLIGNDYSGLDWLSEDIAKPTLEQIQKEIANPTISGEVLAKINDRLAILEKLGITEDEAKLLLS